MPPIQAVIDPSHHWHYFHFYFCKVVSLLLFIYRELLNFVLIFTPCFLLYHQLKVVVHHHHYHWLTTKWGSGNALILSDPQSSSLIYFPHCTLPALSFFLHPPLSFFVHFLKGIEIQEILIFSLLHFSNISFFPSSFHFFSLFYKNIKKKL